MKLDRYDKLAEKCLDNVSFDNEEWCKSLAKLLRRVSKQSRSEGFNAGLSEGALIMKMAGENSITRLDGSTKKELGW